MMRRLLWRARRWQRDLSWPLLAGVLLASLCAAAYVLEILPLAERVAAQRNNLGRLQATSALVPEAKAAATPAEQLESFYAFFPDGEVVPEALERLFAAAARENLSLPQGEYRVAKEQSGRLTRYEITLPLKGSYPGLRRFIAQSLRETPALSLQGAAFTRLAAGDIGVDAQLRFTLFVRTEGL